MNTRFVCQLPADAQTRISDALHAQGVHGSAHADAMASRVCDLTDTLPSHVLTDSL